MTDSLCSINPVVYLLIPVAFIIGSIPFGILFTRNRGIDLRSTGSKNIGATNVLRSAGKLPAFFTLTGDVLKGALPVLTCRYITAQVTQSADGPEMVQFIYDVWEGIIGLTAVLGHMFSIFLKFKGGKGVATGFGVLSVYSPKAAIIMLFIWISVAIISRISSLAALCAVISLPFILVLLKAAEIKIFFGIVLAILIVFRHKSNIKNLITGTESKVGNSK